MQDIARRMMESRSGKLREALDRMTDEEVRALLKGLRLLIESFELSQEGTHEPHR